MRKLSLYNAGTMDGFIAGPNGEIDWLDAGGNLDYGHKEFYESIDTTLMGNSTYRLLASLPEFPYRVKANYVFIRGTPPAPTSYARFISGDIAAFVRALKGEVGGNIWLAGGGQINSVMLNQGLVDEIIQTIFPLVLGESIPLFGPGIIRAQFKTVGCETYETGLVQRRMVRG